MKRERQERGILSAIGSSKPISRFSLKIDGGVGAVVCNNLEALAAIACSIYKQVGGLFIFVADNKAICQHIYDSCDSLLKKQLNLLVLPEKKETDVPGFLGFGEESFATSYDRLLNQRLGVYLLDRKTLNHRFLSRKNKKKQDIELTVGVETNQKKIIDQLISWSYRASDHCTGRGVFAHRGGILDIFPLSAQSPVRVEFDSNKVVSIRPFNIETQLSLSKITAYKIFPPANKIFSEKTKPLKKEIEKTKKTLLYITQELAAVRNKKKILNIYAEGASFSLGSLADKKRVEKLLETSLVFVVNPNNKTFYCSEKMLNCDGFFASGFSIPDLKVCCFVFPGSYPLRKNKKPSILIKNNLNKISSLSSLMWGDFLVHQDFGIGKYCGLQKVVSGGAEEENIKIEYGGGDSVYVPVNNFNRVHKFIGGGKNPKLSRLGSSLWDRQKLQTKKSAEKDIDMLVGLYASRKKSRGFAYKPDAELLFALKQGFLYKETPDQEKAISDVLKDLGKTTPMDRLVYGDVGFGKTEVALRAIISVVSSGRCVFFLSPTTVLSDQHFITCKNRLSEVGLNVELLSRFRTKKERVDILQKLKSGGVDVLVGTHRILSDDVSTKKLGLLIVDEEHRFGVKHKEYIRSLKKRVDVLTLTATPIPRTLQQSLVGIRDTSTIETPPANRLPITTMIKRFDWGFLLSSIKRELARGGQVYFVNNDIKGLSFYKEKILSGVPGSVVEVAHSKMTSRNLERVVLDFFSGKINVLVCTSIVESGLDVQSANTMIINGAQNFGLSQLYQIRGRVGRGGIEAFCFLCIPKKHKLSKQSFQRLKAIEHYTALGSGYSIAMKDLEIRGAGNLFGFEQSGHIVRVGLNLYNKILSETINEQRGGSCDAGYQPVPVSFDGSALFESSYMPLIEDRLYYYQRLSAVKSVDDVSMVRLEVLDRFGKMTTKVENLFYVSGVRVCFKFCFPRRVLFKNNTMSIELDGLPDGISEQGFVLFVAKVEKSVGQKAKVEHLPSGGLAVRFFNLGVKGGVVACTAFDLLFSRAITK